MTTTAITVEEAMEIASYFTAIDREQGNLLRGFLSQYAGRLTLQQSHSQYKEER